MYPDCPGRTAEQLPGFPPLAEPACVVDRPGRSGHDPDGRVRKNQLQIDDLRFGSEPLRRNRRTRSSSRRLSSGENNEEDCQADRQIPARHGGIPAAVLLFRKKKDHGAGLRRCVLPESRRNAAQSCPKPWRSIHRVSMITVSTRSFWAAVKTRAFFPAGRPDGRWISENCLRERFRRCKQFQQFYRCAQPSRRPALPAPAGPAGETVFRPGYFDDATPVEPGIDGNRPREQHSVLGWRRLDLPS